MNAAREQITPHGYDASDRIGAMNYLQQRHAEGELVPGAAALEEFNSTLR